MTEHNINESTINENPEDKLASDQAAEEAHEPTDDLENAPHGDDRLTPERVGEAAIKFATETAYAAAGFAGLVGEKARAFYDEQKKQYVDTHPDEDGAKSDSFLDQLSEQLNRFAEDLTRGYREMAEKGRDVIQRNNPARKSAGSDNTSNDGETPVTEDAATFSSDLSDDVTESQSQDDQRKGQPKEAASGTSDNDGESPVAKDAPAFSSNLSDDVTEKAPESDRILPDDDRQDGIL